MRLRTTTEMMPLHDALKALAFADTDDVDKLLAVEYLNQHAISNFDRTVAISRTCAVSLKRNLAQELHRREVVFGQVPALGLRKSRLLHKLDESNLRRLVSIL